MLAITRSEGMIMKKFRNLIAFLLVSELLVSGSLLCSCKKNDPTTSSSDSISYATTEVRVEEETTKNNESGESTDAPDPTDDYGSPESTSQIVSSGADSSDPASSSQNDPSDLVAPGSDADHLLYTTGLVSFEAPRGYVFDKGSAVDSDTQCKLSFMANPNNKESDYYSIEITTESAAEYRKNLMCYVSLKDYSEGKLDTVSIGGLDFITYESTVFTSMGNMELTTYFYRDEKSGMTVKINQGPGTPEISELFSNITFALPDLGLTDPAFPWQKDAPDIAPTSNTIGDYTISAKNMPFSQRVFTCGRNNGGGVVPLSYTAAWIGASDEYLYSLDLGTDSYLVYKIEENGFTFYKNIPASENYTFYDKNFSDKISLEGISASGKHGDAVFLIEHGENLNLIQIFDGVAVSPDDNLVIHYTYRAINLEQLIYDTEYSVLECRPFTFEFPQTDTCINGMSITENHIIVVASTVDNKDHLYVFDREGHYQQELLDKDGKNMNADNIREIDGGFIGIDTFPMRLILWDQDGNYVGELDEKTLLGLEEKTSDDSFYFQTVSLTQLKKIPGENGSAETAEFVLVLSHADEGVMEDLAFKISITKD